MKVRELKVGDVLHLPDRDVVITGLVPATRPARQEAAK